MGISPANNSSYKTPEQLVENINKKLSDLVKKTEEEDASVIEEAKSVMAQAKKKLAALESIFGEDETKAVQENHKKTKTENITSELV